MGRRRRRDLKKTDSEISRTKAPDGEERNENHDGGIQLYERGQDLDAVTAHLLRGEESRYNETQDEID